MTMKSETLQFSEHLRLPCLRLVYRPSRGRLCLCFALAWSEALAAHCWVRQVPVRRSCCEPCSTTTLLAAFPSTASAAQHLDPNYGKTFHSSFGLYGGGTKALRAWHTTLTRSEFDAATSSMLGLYCG